MTKTLEQTINSVREKTNYADRQAALYRLFTEISLRRFVLSASERELMQTYLFSDLETLYERIDGEPSYRMKNEIAEFAKKLIFVISKVSMIIAVTSKTRFFFFSSACLYLRPNHIPKPITSKNPTIT